MKRTKSILRHDPDIRPLNERMSHDKAKELRKGLKRIQETVNIDFLENQCKMPLFGNPFDIEKLTK